MNPPELNVQGVSTHFSDQRGKQSRNNGKKTISFSTIQNKLVVNSKSGRDDDNYNNPAPLG